ncbi:hypothetical protein C7999DRAFT_15931 [Corynascus novoguineensis]|uniref:Abscission/NoCut checkpoint regulator n=1 Tax=Corynascus novoguineensis TaxID=1126955 RepID=A0AAN7HNB2_9PEZI|nr:hypothetical protein C7999DRAFT_15931 [Corynascus novoguineensis]
MPPSQPSSDQSLLDRLNALKPTSVTIGKPANPASAVGPGTQPESREDALTARLRSLRTQASSSSSSSRGEGDLQTESRARLSGRPDPVVYGHGGTAAPPSVGHGHPTSKPPSAFPKEYRSLSLKDKPSYQIAHSQEAEDEAAVDGLLEALADEDFDLDAAEEYVEPPPELGPGAETTRVSNLLDSLRKDSGSSTSKGLNTPAGESDDDSDGEQMTRAVESVLSQIRDEIRSLPPPAATPPAKDDDNVPAKHRGSDGGAENAEVGPGTGPQNASKDGDGNGNGDGDEDGDGNGNGDGEEPSFTLPAVPSQLPEGAPTITTHNDEDDFEKDISARLASLRGLGSLDDALGLPSAPTFRPQDYDPSSSHGGRGSLLRPSGRYTDEDQKTWCVACLEDATVRCAGCDGDVYCARCWKEMHVGPSAGFEERGHQWERLERRTAPR